MFKWIIQQVHLYYVQLDGLAEGWRFAVQRSRQDAEIDPEDFLWLAMASDLPDLERANNGSDHHVASVGMIVLKAIAREQLQPLIALAHNTAAPSVFSNIYLFIYVLRAVCLTQEIIFFKYLITIIKVSLFIIICKCVSNNLQKKSWCKMILFYIL